MRPQPLLQRPAAGEVRCLICRKAFLSPDRRFIRTHPHCRVRALNQVAKMSHLMQQESGVLPATPEPMFDRNPRTREPE